MHSPVALIPQLAAHIVAAGGKRLRPLLTLAAARLCGYRGDRHVALAACVEFIHTATLLHDDVVDESALRRGQASANALFGNKPSVLVGDFLFARAFQLMVADGSAEGAGDPVAGLRHHRRGRGAAARHPERPRHHRGRNTSRWSRARPPPCSPPPPRSARWSPTGRRRRRRRCEAYGRNLGIAFQLVDDALDYAAEQERWARPWATISARARSPCRCCSPSPRGTEEERVFWRRTLEQREQGPQDLATAQALIARHGALRDTVARAQGYGDQALAALAAFPESPVRRALGDIVAFCIARAR